MLGNDSDKVLYHIIILHNNEVRKMMFVNLQAIG